MKERKDTLLGHLAESDGVDPLQQPPLAKHLKMASNPFLFFRGSASLFYRDLLSKEFVLPETLFELPLTYVMGDCHLSNFGFFTEEGSHGDSVIFALNDFDDACMGHAIWDLSRFVVSLFLAVDYAQGVQGGSYQSDKDVKGKLAVDKRHGESAASAFLHAYMETCNNLISGGIDYHNALEQFEPDHILFKRFKKARSRSSKGFEFWSDSMIARSVDMLDHPMSFKHLPERYQRLEESEYREIEACLAPYVDDQILDIVARVGAGTGSNHLCRYYLLVGPSSATELQLDLCHIVEVKQQKQAAPLSYFSSLSAINQLNPAHLTVNSQRRMQRKPDLVLDELVWRGHHWLVRSRHHAKVGIKPQHVCFGKKNTIKNGFVQYAATCGEALALSHSRGDRRSYLFEEAVVERLPSQTDELITSCVNYAQKVIKDWELLKSSLGA